MRSETVTLEALAIALHDLGDAVEGGSLPGRGRFHNSDRYVEKLQKSPPAVAARLREYAASLPEETT